MPAVVIPILTKKYPRRIANSPCHDHWAVAEYFVIMRTGVAFKTVIPISPLPFDHRPHPSLRSSSNQKYETTIHTLLPCIIRSNG